MDKAQTFYERWSIAIVVTTVMLVPLCLYLAVRAVQNNVNRVEDWLPESYQETQNLAWFRQNFASDQFIIISWQGCKLGEDAEGFNDDPRIELLANLLIPPQQISAAESTEVVVKQPPVVPTISEQDQLARRRYFKSVITGRHMLDRLVAAPLRLPTATAVGRLKGSMIGPDGQQTCLVVTLHKAAIGELKQILGSGKQRTFRQDVPPGLLHRLIQTAGIPASDVHLGGPPVDNSAIDEEGERTLIRLAGLSGLLGLGLAWWSLRSLLLTLLVFFCGVISAATSLAIVQSTGQNLDAILMSMPSLVYVLAISGSVHLVNYYRQAIQAGGLHGAAEQAVRQAWKPAVLCSVTTAVGLLSLSASELLPIRKFGTFSAAGVMGLTLVVYFFLPAALQLSGVGKCWIVAGISLPNGLSSQSVGACRSERFWSSMATFIVKRYRSVGTLCLAVTMIVGYGIQHANSNIDLLKLFDSQAKILQDYRWLERNLGKLVPLEIVVRFPPATFREVDAEPQQYNWQTLGFVQRAEAVARIQSLINRKFGSEGADLVGRSLSAASFLPNLRPASSGSIAFAQRKALDARQDKNRQELSETGFLKMDADDGSELWRISLRVAAFRDIDYGQFVQQLQMITKPLLRAYQTRSEVLNRLTHSSMATSPSTKRVLLWSCRKATTTDPTAHDTFQVVLRSLLEELRCDITLLTDDPGNMTLNRLKSLGKYDAIVACGDFASADLSLVHSFAPNTIDARLRASDKPSMRPSAQFERTSNDISAIYTGVVPIVYQAQRALLESLVESTWWSFLTITPIMMLVSRSVLAGAVAMIPNAVPVLLIFGGMGWLGIPIDIGSMMTASIALGVAVDDTIHFLARYRVELEHSADRHTATIATYSHCAVPTLQAALISGLGLSVFAFSTFTPTQRFGWLMLAILMAGVVAELVLLPALLTSPLGLVFGRKLRRSEATANSTDRLKKLRYDSPHFEQCTRREFRQVNNQK